jgi:hypothetical protein
MHANFSWGYYLAYLFKLNALLLKSYFMFAFASPSFAMAQDLLL